MTSQPLINPEKLATVRLATGEYWVRLALSLTHEFTGGDLVRFAPDATSSIEGADNLSSSYDRANWVSGVTSGALYAFRALGIPRQRVVLTELSGRLRASDMDGVANGSAIAIAKLANRELPSLRPEGWAIQAQVSEPPLAASSPAGQEERAASSRSKRLMILRGLTSRELFTLMTHARSELSAADLESIRDIATERLPGKAALPHAVERELLELARTKDADNGDDGGKEDVNKIPAEPVAVADRPRCAE